MSTISSFKSIQNRHDVYRGKDCMKKFCKSLREHALEIINFKTKKTKLLAKEQHCKEKVENKYVKGKNYCKVRSYYCHYIGEIEVLHKPQVI